MCKALLSLFRKKQPRVIVKAPDHRLREVSKPVKRINNHIREVVADLQEHLGKTYKLKGDKVTIIGLSAPQLGELVQVFVVRFRGLEWVLINPEIVREQGSQRSLECCESLPGKEYQVMRPKLIKIRALSLDGKYHAFKGHDLTAAVLKHEYNHMEGTMIDSIGRRV